MNAFILLVSLFVIIVLNKCTASVPEDVSHRYELAEKANRARQQLLKNLESARASSSSSRRHRHPIATVTKVGPSSDATGISSTHPSNHQMLQLSEVSLSTRRLPIQRIHRTSRMKHLIALPIESSSSESFITSTSSPSFIVDNDTSSEDSPPISPSLLIKAKLDDLRNNLHSLENKLKEKLRHGTDEKLASMKIIEQEAVSQERTWEAQALEEGREIEEQMALVQADHFGIQESERFEADGIKNGKEAEEVATTKPPFAMLPPRNPAGGVDQISAIGGSSGQEIIPPPFRAESGWELNINKERKTGINNNGIQNQDDIDYGDPLPIERTTMKMPTSSIRSTTTTSTTTTSTTTTETPTTEADTTTKTTTRPRRPTASSRMLWWTPSPSYLNFSSIVEKQNNMHSRKEEIQQQTRMILRRPTTVVPSNMRNPVEEDTSGDMIPIPLPMIPSESGASSSDDYNDTPTDNQQESRELSLHEMHLRHLQSELVPIGAKTREEIEREYREDREDRWKTTGENHKGTDAPRDLTLVPVATHHSRYITRAPVRIDFRDLNHESSPTIEENIKWEHRKTSKKPSTTPSPVTSMDTTQLNLHVLNSNERMMDGKRFVEAASVEKEEAADDQNSWWVVSKTGKILQRGVEAVEINTSGSEFTRLATDKLNTLDQDAREIQYEDELEGGNLDYEEDREGGLRGKEREEEGEGNEEEGRRNDREDEHSLDQLADDITNQQTERGRSHIEELARRQAELLAKHRGNQQGSKTHFDNNNNNNNELEGMNEDIAELDQALSEINFFIDDAKTEETQNQNIESTPVEPTIDYNEDTAIENVQGEQEEIIETTIPTTTRRTTTTTTRTPTTTRTTTRTTPSTTTRTTTRRTTTAPTTTRRTTTTTTTTTTPTTTTTTPTTTTRRPTTTRTTTPTAFRRVSITFPPENNQLIEETTTEKINEWTPRISMEQQAELTEEKKDIHVEELKRNLEAENADRHIQSIARKKNQGMRGHSKRKGDKTFDMEALAKEIEDNEELLKRNVESSQNLDVEDLVQKESGKNSQNALDQLINLLQDESIISEELTRKTCKEMKCDFEQGNLCSYETSYDELTAAKAKIKRSKREVAPFYTVRSWSNWVGQFKKIQPNRIDRNQFFSSDNSHFAAIILAGHELGTLTTKVSFPSSFTLSFDCWEATRDVRLRVCCDDLCPFSTDIGFKRGSKNWIHYTVQCPPNTKQLAFECINIGVRRGACGVDNISIIDQTCSTFKKTI